MSSKTKEQRIKASIKEILREQAVRDRVFPQWIRQGRITQQQADERLKAMSDAAKFLQEYLELSCGEQGNLFQEQDKKTPEEIQALKDTWLANPIGNIEDTQGFGAHREELRAFREAQEKHWEKYGYPDGYEDGMNPTVEEMVGGF